MTNEKERIDEVNDDITLISDKDGLTLGTDALLLASYIRGHHKKAAELGSGTGILSLLIAARNKADRILAFEIQDKYAALTRRNVEKNGFQDRIDVVCGDIREYVPKAEEIGAFDLVFTNPPYLPTDVGARNARDDNFIARHEVYGTIADFCRFAARLLRFGGKFCTVYRPDRLPDLFSALRENRLEPKRLTTVCPSADSAPTLVLVEAVSGASPSLVFTKPLYLYTDTTHKEETEEIRHIYETGSFS